MKLFNASDALRAYMNDYEGNPPKHDKFLTPKSKSIDKTLYHESSYLNDHPSVSNNSSNGFVNWVNVAYQNHIDSTCKPAYSGTSQSHLVINPRIGYNEDSANNNKSLASQYSSVTSLLHSPAHKQNITEEIKEQDSSPTPHTAFFENDVCSVNTEILLESSIYGNDPVNMAGELHTSLDTDDRVTRLLNESRTKKKKDITNALSRTIHGTDTRNNEEYSSWIDTLPDYRNLSRNYKMKNGIVSNFSSPLNHKPINSPNGSDQNRGKPQLYKSETRATRKNNIHSHNGISRDMNINRAEQQQLYANKTRPTREDITNKHSPTLPQNSMNKNSTDRTTPYHKTYLADAPHSKFFSPTNPYHSISNDTNMILSQSSRRDSQLSNSSQRTDQLLRSPPNGIKSHHRSRTWNGTMQNDTSSNPRNFIPLQSSSPLKDGVSSNCIDSYQQNGLSIRLGRSPTRDNSIITSNTRRIQEQLARQKRDSHREDLIQDNQQHSPRKQLASQSPQNFRKSDGLPPSSSKPNILNYKYDYTFRKPSLISDLYHSNHDRHRHSRPNKNGAIPSTCYNTEKTPNLSTKRPNTSHTTSQSIWKPEISQFDNIEMPNSNPDNEFDTTSIDTNILLLQTPMPVVNASPSISTVSDDSSDATARAQFLSETEDNFSPLFNQQHDRVYPLVKKPSNHDSSYQLWQQPPRSPRKNQSVEKSKRLNSFIDDCVMTSDRENLLHATADKSEYLSGGNHPSSVEAIKQLVYNLQSLDTNPEAYEKEYGNHQDQMYGSNNKAKRIESKEETRIYNADDESLTRAYYHLNRLKELVNEDGY